MVERAKFALERSEPKRTIVLVTKDEVVIVVLETTPITTPMPNPVSSTAYQDFPATPTTVKTSLLLTFSSQFDITATQVILTLQSP